MPEETESTDNRAVFLSLSVVFFAIAALHFTLDDFSMLSSLLFAGAGVLFGVAALSSHHEGTGESTDEGES